MKGEKEHRSIESAYRDNFRNWEVTPSENFWKGFEKRLRFNQFLRFSTGSFNIYYLGTIVAAGATAAILLAGSPRKDHDKSPDIIIDKFIIEQEVGVASTIPEQNLSKETFKREAILGTEPGTSTDEGSGTVDKKPAEESYEMKNNIKLLKDKLNDSFSDNSREQRLRGRDQLALSVPVARFSIDRSSGCAPMTISFANQSLNYDSCFWEFGDGGVSKESEPLWVFDEPGEFEVSLIVFGPDNRNSVSRQKINVYPVPAARFEINAGDAYLPDEQVVFYNYSHNSISWEWDFGDGKKSNDFEPGHFYDEPGSYTVKLIALSEYGCVDSMVITNAFSDGSCHIIFPNAFTPNDGGPTGGYYSSRADQNAEVFHPVWSGVTQYQLRIFNKQGILLFESNDINVGWDGYYKGQRAELGVYIWKVRGMYKNGQPFVQGGDVTLLPRW